MSRFFVTLSLFSTHFIRLCELFNWNRQTLEEPRALEEVKEERELEWKREVEAFNARKKEMEEWRERDRQWRNRAKVEQLALFEKRQVAFSVRVSLFA